VRFMLKMRIPMVKGNAAINNGSLSPTLQSIIEELQPEAAYVTL
jgi:hypothetical protein